MYQSISRPELKELPARSFEFAGRARVEVRGFVTSRIAADGRLLRRIGVVVSQCGRSKTVSAGPDFKVRAQRCYRHVPEPGYHEIPGTLVSLSGARQGNGRRHAGDDAGQRLAVPCPKTDQCSGSSSRERKSAKFTAVDAAERSRSSGVERRALR